MQEKEKKSSLKGRKSIFRMGIVSLIITCVIMATCSFAFAKEVKVQVDGKSIAYQTNVKTVGELLKENNVKLGDLDRVEPALTTALTEANEIKIIRVKVEEVSSQKEVIFTSDTKDNAELEAGKKQVVQSGKNGQTNLIERVVCENSVEVKRETISEEVVTVPVAEIVEVGTKEPVVETTPVVETPLTVEIQPVVVVSPVVQTPPLMETPVPPEVETPAPPVVEASNSIPEGAVKMTINCTAYTATGNATASGVMPLANHTVASWDGLPFGTKVYIPSLRTTFTVEDRGGAVNEGIIDIYMNTYDECIQFGRQNLEAYIIY